jgi:hypothetical protein
MYLRAIPQHIKGTVLRTRATITVLYVEYSTVLYCTVLYCTDGFANF